MNTHINRKQRLSCVGCMSSSSVATRNYKGSLSERVGQVLPGDLIVLLMNKPGSSGLLVFTWPFLDFKKWSAVAAAAKCTHRQKSRKP